MRCLELIPQMEDVYKQFIALYAEYVDNLQLLKVYANRGIIPKDTAPHFSRPNVVDALKQYRAQKHK